MSYDIRLVCKCCGQSLVVPDTEEVMPRGGTYALGSSDAELNITYNYAPFYYGLECMKDEGVRTIYGMTGEESIPLLEEAVSLLKADAGGYDYWAGTEGNARRALEGLLFLARVCPEGIWEGD